MINCEHCEVKSRSESGMSQHLRFAHPDKWKGNVKASFSEGFDIGQREPGTYHKPTREETLRSAATRAAKKSVPAFAKKGEKKPPIKQKCPWCNFKSIHPPAMAFHIRGNHPKKWKGRLSLSLGMPMTTSDKYLEKKKSRKMAKRIIGKEQPAGRVRIPNNFCENCGHDQRPAQFAKGFMDHGIDEHGHGG